MIRVEEGGSGIRRQSNPDPRNEANLNRKSRVVE
jgi:hypothetical protein